MSEKRFTTKNIVCSNYCVWDNNDKPYGNDELVDLLNEQQATIQRMKHSLNTIYKAFENHYGYDMRNAIWLIDELSYDEFEDKLHIEYDEQKSIIEQLQKENKELKHWKKRIIEYLTDWFNKTEYLSVLYKINEINNEIGLDNDE